MGWAARNKHQREYHANSQSRQRHHAPAWVLSRSHLKSTTAPCEHHAPVRVLSRSHPKSTTTPHEQRQRLRLRTATATDGVGYKRQRQHPGSVFFLVLFDTFLIFGSVFFVSVQPSSTNYIGEDDQNLNLYFALCIMLLSFCYFELLNEFIWCWLLCELMKLF